MKSLTGSSSIQSESWVMHLDCIYSFGLDNDQPETTGISSSGTENHEQKLDIVKDYYVVEN